MIQEKSARLRYLSTLPDIRERICLQWVAVNPLLTPQYFDVLFRGINPSVLPAGFIDTLDLQESRTMPDGVVIPSEPWQDPDQTVSKTSPLSFTQGSLFPEHGDS